MTSYSTDHVWIDPDGDVARVGITDFAQKQLGEVVYIDLPAVGTTLAQNRSFGTIESVKAISELYAPVSGEVVDVNGWLKTKPEAVNTDPMGSWLVAIKLTKPEEIRGLLSAEQYASLAK